MNDKPTSESLAAIIVSNRILGLNSDEAKYCMSELLRRREDESDPFEFEKYIDDQIRIIEDSKDKIRSDNVLVSVFSAMKKRIT